MMKRPAVDRAFDRQRSFGVWIRPPSVRTQLAGIRDLWIVVLFIDKVA